jgi:hypothetical protein
MTDDWAGLGDQIALQDSAWLNENDFFFFFFFLCY